MHLAATRYPTIYCDGVALHGVDVDAVAQLLRKRTACNACTDDHPIKCLDGLVDAFPQRDSNALAIGGKVGDGVTKPQDSSEAFDGGGQASREFVDVTGGVALAKKAAVIRTTA